MLLDTLGDGPAMPEVYYKNCPGMEGIELMSPEEKKESIGIIDRLWQQTSDAVMALQAVGLHKQSKNRYLHAFNYIDTILTATDWNNFLNLRLASGAQPEIRRLAQEIEKALACSIPTELGLGEWHLPFYDHEKDSSIPIDTLKGVCAARCARVSYGDIDMLRPVDDDLRLAQRLLTDKHASPFEHVARPMHISEFNLVREVTKLVTDTPAGTYFNSPTYFGNLKGWVSYRRELGI
jgi:hypothetical protein